MHDIKFIRENPEAFAAGQRRRGAFSVDPIVKLDEEMRGYLSEIENLKATLNHKAREYGEYKRRKEEPPAELAADISWQKGRLAVIEGNPNQNPAELKKRLDNILASLPNLPATDVPDGEDEGDNEQKKLWGTLPAFEFTPREHFDIGTPLGLDLESAAVVSGARFAYLRGQVARLNRALGAFMLDTHTAQFGYEEVAPPVLVRDEAMFGTAQLPKFKEDLFETSLKSITPRSEWWFELTDALAKRRGVAAHELEIFPDEADYLEECAKAFPPEARRWLIPTAEVSLTNLVREKILNETELPLRFTALTLCFRSEAGAAGRDTRGLIRQHQFDKVELVSITTPEQSEAEHGRMTGAAEAILEALNLPYRRMLLCAGDMGFSARKTYDLEVWLPGQGRYREISSCSNCGDFQARRMNARYRPTGEKAKPTFVHTLNGSGLAVGRTLVAVLENYQQADGSVIVPEALRAYTGGLDVLVPAT